MQRLSYNENEKSITNVTAKSNQNLTIHHKTHTKRELSNIKKKMESVRRKID